MGAGCSRVPVPSPGWQTPDHAVQGGCACESACSTVAWVPAQGAFQEGAWPGFSLSVSPEARHKEVAVPCWALHGYYGNNRPSDDSFRLKT